MKSIKYNIINSIKDSNPSHNPTSFSDSLLTALMLIDRVALRDIVVDRWKTSEAKEDSSQKETVVDLIRRLLVVHRSHSNPEYQSTLEFDVELKDDIQNI